MKTKLHSLLILLFAFATANTFAQIPNSGFENWTPVGNYMDPNGWLTPNSLSAGSFYPVTRDVSHFPSSVGSYSIRIGSNPPLLPGAEALGLVLQNKSGVLMNGPGPAFPIVGHPTSLTGYYKYAPVYGDTMIISIQLFQNGASVAYGYLTGTASAPNWISFNIPISNYTTADSGSILLASYFANGPPPLYVPHGNSVLNIDNLNFDVLITGISEVNETNRISVYPNPFNSSTTIQLNSTINNGELNIFNVFGQKIKTINHISGDKIKIDRDNLQSGIYFIRLTQDNKTLTTDKLIITD